MAQWEQGPELKGQRGPVATGPRRTDPGRRPPGPRLPGRRRGRRGRIRRLARHPAVRALAGLLLAGFCWLSFSVGQALTAPDGGSVSARLAEWARDHYLGPVVTFGEWLTYQPPAVGGKPPFSLAAPSAKPTLAHHRGFAADVPGPLAPFARPPLPGEGVWRLAEAVHGEPAVYVTFLRVDSVHTSYVAGVASFDQRLVRFQLRPGSQDPGPASAGASRGSRPGSGPGCWRRSTAGSG